MAVEAFSPEWAQAFKDEINRSPVYRDAGKGWKWTVGLVVEAEPDKGACFYFSLPLNHLN